MGVYIKKMDKPMSCASCKLCVDDDCILQEELYLSWAKQREHCPLIEVKASHGDLINKNELLKEIHNYLIDLANIAEPIQIQSWANIVNADDSENAIISIIKRSPTVIEAEME